ncbi:MAG: hypothetical protein COV29_00585 [Candidatus Yanofskybacteria bacterium CG10_big_fil_rev_8_21_14_0_10_36_16]|uniref:GIY-YIG domain-containing protein n=1 Tax=Candidatus Yanofskybacteria bacterium CG10_big_fil_rev_8_21_14_0_10_36_16 TaxID=1975096 RepID=A0A2J0Q8Q7_9BACT|nr:MAG: hypothetical protein COV29_00585 [Candidatus Yanofskybacteria bacterium CG10_big_fil_rev_8_21_14_0_10_36_16]
MDKKWYIYVLKSKKDSKYFIGSTSNIKNRIEKHNSGATKSTKNRRPLILRIL